MEVERKNNLSDCILKEPAIFFSFSITVLDDHFF